MKQHTGTPLILILLCMTALFAGCSEEKVRGKLTFDNNNECISWSQSTSTIKFPQAHSGNYVCKINKENPFSNVLNIRVSEISNKPLKRATITAWFMLTSNGTEQNLVMDVRDSSQQNSFEWINVDAADNNNELNKWRKAELVVDLTKKDRNNINNVYRIYASNGRDEAVYVDDFEVSFEE